MNTKDLLLDFDAREMWLGAKEDRPESDECTFFITARCRQTTFNGYDDLTFGLSSR